MTRWLQRLALIVLVLGCSAGTALANPEHGDLQRTPATEDLFDYVAGAQTLEGQLLAPCCWNQTLDIHGSETSNDLRREIRQRLKSGQDVDTIRADIVKRYGERILAVPPASPLKGLAVALSIIFGIAGIFAIVLLKRWRRRHDADKSGTLALAGAAPRDEWDDRLENELDKLER